MISDSPRFSIGWADVYKGLRGAVLVAAAAFIIGGFEAIQELANTGSLGDFEIMRTFLVGGTSFILEELRRYFKDYTF